MIWNNFLRQEIISFDRKIFSLTWNHFLWQELISFDKKSFPLTGNHIHWQESISIDRKAFLILLDMKHFIWQEIISFQREIIPLTRNHILQQEIISLNFFCLYISWERRDSCQVFRLSSRISWEPGSQVPREYPTLGGSIEWLLSREEQQVHGSFLLQETEWASGHDSKCQCWDL